MMQDGAAVAALARRTRALELAVPPTPFGKQAQTWDHFDGAALNAKWATTLVGTGSVTLPNATPTYVRLASGATSASTATLHWGARLPFVGMASYAQVRARARVPTAVDAAATCRIGLWNNSSSILQVGVRGSSSAAFFVCFTNKAGVNRATVTAVPVDTAWHEFVILAMPDRARFYIDGVHVLEETDGTVLPTAVALQPFAFAGNGTTGADRQLDVDWLYADERE